VRGRAVILPSVEAQMAAGDRDIIDPAAVKASGEVPVHEDFNYNRMPVGFASNFRVEEGCLVADIEFVGGSSDTGRYGFAGMQEGGAPEWRLLSIGQLSPEEA
jgi:hypothetical protein